MRFLHCFRATIAALAVVVAVAGCEVLSQKPSPLGGTWHVAELNGVAVDHADAAVIQFTVGGEIQGSSGCHDFRGPAQIGDGTLGIGTLSFGVEVVPCLQSTREVEGAFLAALRQVSRFRGGLPSDELVLAGDGGTIVLADGL